MNLLNPLENSEESKNEKYSLDLKIIQNNSTKEMTINVFNTQKKVDQQ